MTPRGSPPKVLSRKTPTRCAMRPDVRAKARALPPDEELLQLLRMSPLFYSKAGRKS